MIDEFRGKYAFLSNFYPSQIEYEGKTYNSIEAAYQAQKCPENADAFVGISSKDAKQLGKKVNLRDDWNVVKIDIMYDLLKLKFAIPHLRQKLLDTGDEELVEGNWWGDIFWGICNDEGQNILGKLLMEIRTKKERNNGE